MDVNNLLLRCTYFFPFPAMEKGIQKIHVFGV